MPPSHRAGRRPPRSRPPTPTSSGTTLKHDLVLIGEVGFAPLDSTSSQLLFRCAAAAYERRFLAIASYWPSRSGAGLLPKHSTAVSLLNRLLHHSDVVATDGESYAEGWSNQVRTTLHEALTHHARVGTFFPATSGDTHLAIDTFP